MPYPDRRNAWPYEAHDETQVKPATTRLALRLVGAVVAGLLLLLIRSL